MYVIEFEKRGLPHAHIVVKFKNDSPDRTNDIDSWVWAQLPDASIANGVLREKVSKILSTNHAVVTTRIARACKQTEKTTPNIAPSFILNRFEHLQLSMKKPGVPNIEEQTTETILQCVKT